MESSAHHLSEHLLDQFDKILQQMKLLPVSTMLGLLESVEHKLEKLKKEIREKQIFMDEDSDSEAVDDVDEEISIVVEENGNIMQISQTNQRQSSEEHRPQKQMRDMKKCCECEKSFKSKSEMLNHLLLHHPDSSSVFSCSKCDKKFLSDVGLYLHNENKHPATLGKMMICSEPDCKYSSRSKQLFRSHQQSHESSVCRKCPVCDKEYIGGSSAFTNHMKLHTGDKNYTCNSCDKKFVSQSRLTQHMVNVHDPPKYKCHDCGKMFRSKPSYDRHVLVHSNVKPFSCEFCDYKARTIGNLTSHVKSVHGIKDFTVGKKAKTKKLEKLAEKVLVNSEMRSLQVADDVKQFFGGKETQKYISSLTPEKRLTVQEMREAEKLKQSKVSTKHNRDYYNNFDKVEILFNGQVEEDGVVIDNGNDIQYVIMKSD